MGLTEEQKRRIEENRKKALAKRQEKSGQLPSRNPVPEKKSIQPSKSSTNVLAQQRPVPASNSMPKLGSNFVHKSSSTFRTKVTKCKFVMISRGEFKVEMSYHTAAIAIFKSMTSGSYNATERAWHFRIENHDELARKLRSLGSEIQVDSLPRWIIKTFLKGASGPVTKRRSINNEDDGSGPIVEPTLWDNLMPFQKDGVRYALERNGNILLADDMGLGKTIQSLSIATAYQDKWPLLIVCPSSMRFAWKSAVVRWIPSVPEESINVILGGNDDCDNYEVIIISYDLVAKKEKELKNCRFRVVILDESHFLKNYKSQRCKAATAILNESSEHSILLSGTPALSRPIELFPQINLVDKNLFPYVTDFGMRYCDGRKVSFGKGEHFEFSGSSNMHELKLLMEERFMLRRMKTDVLAQLPPKQRQMVILDPNLVKSQSKIMKSQATQMSNKSLSKSERKSLLLEWFHTTSDAKVKAVKEYLKDLLENGNKFICFAHHQSMLNAIEELLVNQKFGYIRIDGSTSSSLRAQYCDDFQTSEKVKVALLSVTAANTGLTLTSAQLVVFAELFWNPGVLTQAEDRAHRIGQVDSVTVRYLVAQHTADDELWPMIQKKLDVLNKAGLSKENFMENDAKNLHQRSAPEKGKITAHLTPKATASISSSKADDTDLLLESIDWDDDFDEEISAKRVKL